MTGWWRRNRWALLALLALVPASVLASSYRYVTLYLPVHSPPVVRADKGTVAFDRQIVESRTVTYRSTFTVHLDHAGPAHDPATKAANGATLWRADLTFEASPDVPITCSGFRLLDGEGREYASGAAVTSEDRLNWASCVPLDAPGPTFTFDGKPVPPDVPRPASWRVPVWFAVPNGVTPDRLRISLPGYDVEFAVP